MNSENFNTAYFDPVGTHTLKVISKAGKFNKWMYESIKRHLYGNILEIGSGIGNISKFVIQDKFTLTLSDFNPEYQNLLSKKYSGVENVRDIFGIDLQHPDFETLYHPLKEYFDVIFMLNVIEHIKDDLCAIENCRYMLKNGGSLIGLAPAYQFLYCNPDRG